MDLQLLDQHGECEWHLPRRGAMRVPGVIYGDAALLADMDDRVAQQVRNVASLPGIALAAYALPDAHSGYGFPIGGVAAFDPAEGGVVSAGGVGFDVSFGVRMLHTGLSRDEWEVVKTPLVEALFDAIPAGLGRGGALHLDTAELDAMRAGGARWAVDRGYGRPEDNAPVPGARRARAGGAAGRRLVCAAPRGACHCHLMHKPLRLILGGDPMAGRGVDQMIAAHGPQRPLAALQPYLAGVDLVGVNLECAITARNTRYAGPPKAFYFRARPAAVEVLRHAGSGREPA